MRRVVPSEYKVVVADPPWSFGDKLPGKTRGAERNYKVMSQEEIEAYQLPAIAPDALLFLWRVASQVEEACAVTRAWGFTPKSEIVWVKTSSLDSQVEYLAGRMPKLHFGMGRYVRMSHENCIIAARGKALSIVESHSVRSVFFAPVGRHSEKPEEFYQLVEEMAPNARPRLELFARRHREGWTCLGDELDEAPVYERLAP